MVEFAHDAVPEEDAQVAFRWIRNSDIFAIKKIKGKLCVSQGADRSSGICLFGSGQPQLPLKE